jgi:P-type Cu+ transporter
MLGLSSNRCYLAGALYDDPARFDNRFGRPDQDMEPERKAVTGPENRPPAVSGSRFSVDGMSCNNCVRHVTQAMLGVPGVASATVSLDTQQAVVEWVAGASRDPVQVLEAVRKAGFGAKEVDAASTQDEAARPGGNAWQRNLWVGAACLLPMMTGEWVLGLSAARWFQWLSLALAAVVQTVAGSRFYRGTWNQLKSRSANMDTLVALGSTTAFTFSVWGLLQGGVGHLYFMEAAAIITLISFGHWLESRISQRASGSLRRLLHLAPAQARRRSPDGTETLVPVAELRAGDAIALRPGDRVPADGRVLSGDSAVDESMLTGEAVPVDKSADARVYTGTVNLNGRLVVDVTATGQATALAAIIAAVQRAQNSRAAIQRLGDQVSSVFVPVVILLAVGTALWWGLAGGSALAASQQLARALGMHVPVLPAATAAFIYAAAVLIVACPCAMGLATPIAIMAGTNAAAERGILIRDGIALEKAGRITTVVFDKTGTLTSGRPTVVDRASYGEGRGDGVDGMRLAAEMARHSNHPLSQAVAGISSEPMPLLNWEEVRGSGIRCQVSTPGQPGQPVAARFGSLNWLQTSGVDLACADAFIERHFAQGATLVGIAVEERLLGVIALQDRIKTDAPEVVAELRRQGYKVRLVTGDNHRTASAVGALAGIGASNIHANVRPEEKARLVKQFQADGERVAFVGDGLNDAPALEQADLGIAVSRASDIALEAADLILLRSDIEAVPESLGLARAALRTIKQNLFWAFFYNALGIPLAALGLLNPMICAAAMGLSDLVVIGNALRLRHWRQRVMPGDHRF